MSSFFALWKRARLWRVCLLFAILGLVLTLSFPTIWLRHHITWLPDSLIPFKKSNSLRHLSGASPSSEEEAGAEQTTSSSSGPHSEPERHYLDLDTVVQFSATLAGRQIPLPAGQWHPILEARTKERFPIAFMALARVNHNIITGLILAETSLAPTPAQFATTMSMPCHDDRNTRIERHETPVSAECIILEPALFTGLAVNNDDFINDSLARLRLSGFIMPPFMIAASWRYLHLDEGNRAADPSVPMAHFMAVDTLLPPLAAGSKSIPLTMLGSFEDWQQALSPASGKAKNPTIRYFTTRMTQWLHQWRPLLLQGYNAALPPASLLPSLLNRPAMRDPMANTP